MNYGILLMIKNIGKVEGKRENGIIGETGILISVLGDSFKSSRVMAKFRNIIILGVTGSIGRQTVDVIRNDNRFRVTAISGHRNIRLLEKYARELKPKYTIVTDEKAYSKFKKNNPDIKTVFGQESIIKAVTLSEVDTVVVALVGISGFLPTVHAIKSGKTVALANKEALVCGGSYIRKLQKETGSKIIPVDSEHNAVFNLLKCSGLKDVKRIILTASGGPLLNMTDGEVKNITPSEALNHPVWKMGKRITIDSATMLNKGFEVIEAHHLFGIDYNNIDVIIHPEGLIHSAIELVDGEYYMQFGPADMRLPISNALYYPEIRSNSYKKVDLLKTKKLTFEKPGSAKYPLLKIAYEAGIKGGTYPAVLNALDEELVALFLRNRIGFTQIAAGIKNILKRHVSLSSPGPDEILSADKWAREEVKKKYTGNASIC